METNLKPVTPNMRDNGLKFNVSECLSYIDGIEDFTLEFESKPSYDDISETMLYVAESIAVKSFLRTFVMKCKKESARAEEYDFVKWLRGRRRHWKVQQYQVVGCLNDRLQMSPADDRAGLEKRLQRYLDFFHHNCKLIEMMLGDVMNDFGQTSRKSPADNNRWPDETAVEDFEQLFREGRDAEPYFQLLRDHEYPLIGRQYNYISRSLKSGFCIWIYELQRQHIIEYRPERKYAQLLFSRITGLKTFSHSLFAKINNAAEERYSEYFMKKIALVKLSQDSANSAR